MTAKNRVLTRPPLQSGEPHNILLLSRINVPIGSLLPWGSAIFSGGLDGDFVAIPGENRPNWARHSIETPPRCNLLAARYLVVVENYYNVDV